jgi:hypothetical protein
MSPRKQYPSKTLRQYQITVEGRIDASWSEWLGGLQIVTYKMANDMEITTLNGEMLDQAFLRGLLNRLWDLNLVLYSVRQFDP